MLKVLLIFAGLITLFCLYLAIVCLFAAAREYELPDVDEVEVGETGTPQQ
jgi:hypothetical protein